MSGIYVASKFAMEGFSDSLRREVAPLGVSVSVIEPGYVKSSIFASSDEVSVMSPEKQAIADQFYSKHIDAKAKEKRANTLRLADEPTVTTAAIIDAISSKYPQTRYPVANANGIPATVISWLVWALPDRVLDIVFA
jgi:short-subunit dehydrogenase